MTVREFTFPKTKLIVGNQSIKELPKFLIENNYKRVFIVADKALKHVGILDEITARLSDIVTDTYAEIQGDPTTKIVNDGLRQIKEFDARCVVAIGGGSAIDAAKAIAIVAMNDQSIEQAEGFEQFTHDPLPIIAIPTTAGTGSEISLASVITNEKESRKITIRGNRIAPEVAILDPDLLRTLPANVAATAGMDAFCHNIENFITTSASPLSEGLNLQGIRLIHNNIREFVADRSNTEAAKAMLEGSMIGGIPLTVHRLTVNHAFAHPLGAHLHIHHGLACAIMLPYSLRFNMEYCLDKLPLVAQTMGVNIQGLSKQEASESAIQAVEKMISDLKIPKGLKEFNISEQDIPILARDAMKSTQLQVNPRPVTQQDIEEIFSVAIRV